LIRNSTLAFIDKCGHMPWLEQPEQTWKIVSDFLAHLPNWIPTQTFARQPTPLSVAANGLTPLQPNLKFVPTAMEFA